MATLEQAQQAQPYVQKLVEQNASLWIGQGKARCAMATVGISFVDDLDLESERAFAVRVQTDDPQIRSALPEMMNGVPVVVEPYLGIARAQGTD